MGLSILIPVFNTQVTNLVKELANQLSILQKEAEIIVWDDGSDKYAVENESLQTLPPVVYRFHKENQGRMIVRRELCQLARFQYLLFLDADSQLIHPGFLETYFLCIEKNIGLVAGGRVYTASAPADCSFRLHWKYGSKREKATKGASFMSNNFLIRKQLFEQLDYSLVLKEYGHEDTWWGIQFEKMGVSCIQVKNPVLHASLEESSLFLKKSEQALANLLLLSQWVGEERLASRVKIFRWYHLLRKYKLAGLYRFFISPFGKHFRNNLLSCSPRLFYFDCYRLLQLLELGRSFKKTAD